MKEYVKNMKKYVKNMKEYVDILDLALPYLYVSSLLCELGSVWRYPA